MKSTLIVEFAGQFITYNVEWNGTYIMGLDEDPCEELFFSEKYEHLWDTGHHPSMSIKAENGFTSNVTASMEAGELFSNKPLEM